MRFNLYLFGGNDCDLSWPNKYIAVHKYKYMDGFFSMEKQQTLTQKTPIISCGNSVSLLPQMVTSHNRYLNVMKLCNFGKKTCRKTYINAKEKIIPGHNPIKVS